MGGGGSVEGIISRMWVKVRNGGKGREQGNDWHAFSMCIAGEVFGQRRTSSMATSSVINKKLFRNSVRTQAVSSKERLRAATDDPCTLPGIPGGLKTFASVVRRLGEMHPYVPAACSCCMFMLLLLLPHRHTHHFACPPQAAARKRAQRVRTKLLTHTRHEQCS